MYRRDLQILGNPRCLGLVTIRRLETRLNSSKDNLKAKSFRLFPKMKLGIPLNFLFPFVSFIGVFSY